MQTVVSIALVIFSIFLVVEAFRILRHLRGGGFGQEELLAICLVVAGVAGALVYFLDLLSFVGVGVRQAWIERVYVARGCFNVLLPLMFLRALQRRVQEQEGKEDV